MLQRLANVDVVRRADRRIALRACGLRGLGVDLGIRVGANIGIGITGLHAGFGIHVRRARRSGGAGFRAALRTGAAIDADLCERQAGAADGQCGCEQNCFQHFHIISFGSKARLAPVDPLRKRAPRTNVPQIQSEPWFRELARLGSD